MNKITFAQRESLRIHVAMGKLENFLIKFSLENLYRLFKQHRPIKPYALKYIDKLTLFFKHLGDQFQTYSIEPV